MFGEQTQHIKHTVFTKFPAIKMLFFKIVLMFTYHSTGEYFKLITENLEKTKEDMH